MRENQPLSNVTPDELVAKVKSISDAGWRLVQMCATRLPEGVEVNYSFDKFDGKVPEFQNLRLMLPAEAPKAPSVSGVYWNAFLYENEMHDLFGITFDGLVLDFKGTLYKTAKKHAFSELPLACAPKPAPAAPAKPAAPAAGTN